MHEQDSVHQQNTSSQSSGTAGVAAATKPRRQYAARGSQGTFGGKRPPKNPVLLKEFLKKKAAYEAQKESLRMQKDSQKVARRPTPTQESYQAWQRAFDWSSSSSSRSRFIEAAAQWQAQKAQQVAEKASLF